MTTRSIMLTDELDSFVATRVESGRYEDASEVVRAALRSLEREEHRYDTQVEALRAFVDEGDRSGIAEEGVFERVRQSLRLDPAR